ncbi:MAG: hypothetical protein IPL49_13460 [Saprospirales bacterium]|nr:hypothetical protein [Saprospirales bacterium]MBK8491858.1 hypothetical protein [Saprospirales bacterium]
MKGALCVFFILLLGLWTTDLSGQAPEPEDAQQARCGIYLMNLYDLNVSEYSFYADFYVWMKWEGDRDPMNIEFVNAVEKWGFTQLDFSDTAEVLEDGSSYNGMRIEGRFFHSFDLRRFPLDRHELDIRIENVDYPQDSLAYIPETEGDLFRKDFAIPGWQVEGARMETHSNFYNTDFGDPGAKDSTFSNFTFKLVISRPLSYFLLKLLLPLLVVIMASLGGLLIHPNHIDARISLPIGGLLSCVFLQQSYSSALPDVGYMVLMDKIYLLSYMLIAAIMLRIIVVGNRLNRKERKDPDVVFRRDRRYTFYFFILFLMGAGVLILIS